MRNPLFIPTGQLANLHTKGTDMKILFVAVNAQYIHTNLAVRLLAEKLAGVPGVHTDILESNINQHGERILEKLYAAGADVYLFSCYIWNVEIICQLARELRKIRPQACIAVGGPQVDACAVPFLQRNPAFDAVFCGEGEDSVPAFVNALQQSGAPQPVAGVALRRGPDILEGPAALLPDLDSLPFAYSDLDGLSGRIVYYESMRGCPFRCSYCRSGRGQRVRYKGLDKVFAELDRLLAARVRQVKFVDRTFNCDLARARAIWAYLVARDNGVTGFHFEMEGHLLDGETIDYLATVRPGLFQFEIGVQSTSPDTLRAIDRNPEVHQMFGHVRRLNRAGNIHLHLDLIAGLPFETAERFARSFDDVYRLAPHQMQVGFLKVLEGSKLQGQIEAQGLVYLDSPPFEILYNKWISYQELCGLKQIAALVELYHNSGRFIHSIGYLMQKWDSPFAFYQALAARYYQRGHGDVPLGKLGQYDFLGVFAKGEGLEIDEKMQWLCRLDMAEHEKPHNLPAWVTVDGSRPYRERVLAFYQQEGNLQRYLPEYGGRDPKQILKMAHVEVLPFDYESGAPGPCALLFNYERRDLTGQVQPVRIQLPE